MVDALRYELTQVMRKCKEIELNLKSVNKILNGKYKEVIDDYQKEPRDLDAIALPPVNMTAPIEDTFEKPNEPTHLDSENKVVAPSIHLMIAKSEPDENEPVPMQKASDIEQEPVGENVIVHPDDKQENDEVRSLTDYELPTE